MRAMVNPAVLVCVVIGGTAVDCGGRSALFDGSAGDKSSGGVVLTSGGSGPSSSPDGDGMVSDTSSTGGAVASGGSGAPLDTGAAPSVGIGSTVTGGTVSGGGGVPGAASGPAPVTSGGSAVLDPCGLLVDDMESGSGHICEGSGRKGVWYSFNDLVDNPWREDAAQWPEPSTPGVPIPVADLPEPRGESRKAIHTFGENFWDWGAGVGLDLSFDGSTYGLYDASAYGGIAFWARSDLSSEIAVRVSSEATTSVAYGGTCTREIEGVWTCDPSAKGILLTPDWQRFELPFLDFDDDFCGPLIERSRLTNIQFLFAQGDPFDFWIDDVEFVPAATDDSCCANAMGGTNGTLWFDDSRLESWIRLAVGRETGPLRCGDVCPLTRLCATGLEIASLGGLESIPLLQELDLSSNQIDDLTPLASLGGLRWLDLTSNTVERLDPLATLANIEVLLLGYNRIVDITPLARLVQLNYIDLRDNSLSELNALSGLNNLRYIDLSENQITGVSPLVDNIGLGAGDSVALSGNPLDCSTELENLRVLDARSVSVFRSACYDQ